MIFILTTDFRCINFFMQHSFIVLGKPYKKIVLHYKESQVCKKKTLNIIHTSRSFSIRKVKKKCTLNWNKIYREV